MSIYRSKIFAAAIKLETTSGTDIVPSLAVAADTLRLLNTPNLRPAYIEDGKSQNPQHGGMARIQRYQPKGRWGQVELVVELRGKGSAYTGVSDFVEMDTLLQAAGFNKGFNVSKVEYTTVDSGIPTASLYLYNMAGKLIKMVGCVSKGPKFTFTAGQPATASFTVVGRIASVTEAAPVSPAFNTVMAPVWSDVTVTMGAYSTAAGSPDQFVPRRIEVDVQTTEAARPWAGANALIGYAIVDRQARVSLDMEAVPLASFDPYTLADQATVGATDTKLVIPIGSATGNTVTVYTGQVMFEPPDDTDMSGLAGYTLAGDVMARSISSGTGANRDIGIAFA
jgi:hypothetical protein